MGPLKIDWADDCLIAAICLASVAAEYYQGTRRTFIAFPLFQRSLVSCQQ